MRVSIIGTGYVGLVSGACLCEKGHHVVCVDTDRTKVDAITKAIPPFHEPGLDALLKRHAGKLLFATTDLKAAVVDSDLTLIATGTPFDGKTIDLTYVKQATKQVGEALRAKKSYHVVAVKSTVVPGTTDSVVLPILEEASGRRAGDTLGVGMNPEFLSEGSAIEDFMVPDRIVLGGIDDRSRSVQAEMYRGFEGTPVLNTSNATAEFIKYSSNALLATLISYSNEIANLCATVPGVDAADVMRGMHLMRELSHMHKDGSRSPAGINSFLFPGCGFGGSCLPKDVKALSAWGSQRERGTPLLEAVLKTNQDQPARTVELVERGLASRGGLNGAKIALLGLAFKPGTDDVRESPAFPIIALLTSKGASVKAFDPVADKTAGIVLKGKPGVEIVPALDAALAGIDAAVLVTRWEDFRGLPARLAKMSPPPLLVDGRRMLSKADYARYSGIGLGPASSSPVTSHLEGSRA
jgi:UDPglucose 6-dehydrogenase/GDP-mannose 6-dehydrogenase